MLTTVIVDGFFTQFFFFFFLHTYCFRRHVTSASYPCPRQFFISKFDFSNALIISVAITLPLSCSHLHKLEKFLANVIVFVHKSNTDWTLFNFMTFYFTSKYTEIFASLISFIKSAFKKYHNQ